jgi:hypothetical protein
VPPEEKSRRVVACFDILRAMALQRRILRAAFFASFAALVGCSALVGFDGFVGGASADAAPASESGTDVRAADGAVAQDGAADGARDGSVTPGDAAVDAADGGVGATGAYCASLTTAPKFCDDFERDGGVQGAWSQSNVAGNASLTLESEPGRGGFLRSTVSGNSSSGSVAFLALVVASPINRFTMRWKMRIPSLPASTANVELMDHEILSGQFEYREVLFYLTGGIERMAWDYQYTDGSLDNSANDVTSKVPVNVWNELTLTVDLQNRTSTLLVNGAMVSVQNLPLDFAGPAPDTIYFGINDINGPGSPVTISVDFDDVAFDYQ